MSVAETRVLTRLAKLGVRAERERAELDAIRAHKRIRCGSCGRRTTVAKLTYTQTHFYIEPHGCTGGDYWRLGEGQFDCPKCGATNRLYDRPEVVALKPYFGRVEKAYDR